MTPHKHDPAAEPIMGIGLLKKAHFPGLDSRSIAHNESR